MQFAWHSFFLSCLTELMISTYTVWAGIIFAPGILIIIDFKVAKRYIELQRHVENCRILWKAKYVTSTSFCLNAQVYSAKIKYTWSHIWALFHEVLNLDFMLSHISLFPSWCHSLILNSNTNVKCGSYWPASGPAIWRILFLLKNCISSKDHSWSL